MFQPWNFNTNLHTLSWLTELSEWIKRSITRLSDAEWLLKPEETLTLHCDHGYRIYNAKILHVLTVFIYTLINDNAICVSTLWSQNTNGKINIWSGAFTATKYNKIFSGYQPRQVVEWQKKPTFSTLRTRTKMVLETLIFSPSNHLTQLVARENFIKAVLNFGVVGLHTYFQNAFFDILCT
jgi:hypothetical protein